MSKQLNVNLNFSANTSQAKMQIQELQTSLNNLIAGSVSNKQLPITKELVQAQSAASSLKVALDSAVNTQTGKLDLSKFSTSLGNAGLNLKTLQTQLQALGPAGAQTFQSLATSIMQAEVPLTRSNALVGQLWTTLKNTARWQISSSILHGFIKTLHGAIGYAKDLNQSLNNIRIVTGQSVEQMAKFAEQANRSAKALNATTTEYTKASLIFYQQGLSDSEVQARTDVVIKMANVTRQSAEVVSDQLTAVWNNFYNGTDSLESFADKMVALGAATASSSDEIAGGLEKFAAIGETIGLSFDYAAAALATITSNTRQSEEVVGTALKTIFARIQGLKLGETLDDGTDLNKYSEALQSVGINIKDQNDKLKNMDTILEEMGNKWGTLNKDQQVALAQTVAGVRQYTQLVSLMDNWDSGDRDSFQANLDTIDSSDGALQKQADIYAESWEAARKRVKVAAEDIYDSLLNDEFIITLTEGFGKFLELIGTFIDSLGGLPGTLALLGTLMTKVFGEQMAASLQRLAYNVRSLSGANQAAAQQLKQEAYDRASKVNFNDGTEVGAATNKAMKSQLNLQNELMNQQKLMTKEEYARYEKLLEINRAYGDQAIAAAKAVDAARQKTQDTNRDIRRVAMSATNEDGSKATTAEQYSQARSTMKSQAKTAVGVNTTIQNLNKELQAGKVKDYDKYIKQVNNSLNLLGKNNTTANSMKKLNTQLQNGEISLKQYKKEMNKLASSGELMDDAVFNMSDKFRENVPATQNMSKEVDKLAQEELDAAMKTRDMNRAMDDQKKHTNEVKNAIAGFKSAMSGFSGTVVGLFNGVSQLSMGIMSLKGAWDTLNNPDISGFEKILSVMMSLSMAIPALIGGYQALFVARKGEEASVLSLTGQYLKNLAVKGYDVVATAATAISSKILAAAKTAETGSVWANTAAWLANPIMWIALIIVAVIAAVALLVAGIIALSNALTAEEKAAQNAAAYAEAMAEKYNRLTEEANKFKEAVSNYHTAVESLKKLEKGTIEYEEALKEANEEAMKLIETYGLWQDFTRDKTGLIVFNDGVLEGIQTEKDAAANEANRDRYASKIISNSKNNDLDETDVQKEIGLVTVTTKYTAYNGNEASTSTNRQINDSEMDELVDAMSKSGFDFTNTSTEDFKEWLKNPVDEMGNAMTGFSSAIADNVDALVKNKDAIVSYAKTVDEAGDANEKYAEEILRITMTDTDPEKEKLMNVANNDEELYNQILNGQVAIGKTVTNSSGQTLEQAIAAIDVGTTMSNAALADYGYEDMNDEKTARAYARDVLGYTQEEVDAMTYEGGTGQGSLKLVDGTKIIDGVSDDTMRVALATKTETDKITQEFEGLNADVIENYQAAMGKLADSGNLGKGIIASLQNGVGNEDYSQLYGTISSEEQKEELQNLSADDLMSRLGITEEDIKALGYSSANEWKTAFDEGLEGWTMEGFRAAQEKAAKSITDQAASKYELDADVLDRQRKLLQQTHEGLADNAEAAAKMAVANQRMNKGVNTLTDSWKDWNKTLRSGDKTTQDYAEALIGAENAMRDILSLSDESVIPEDFLQSPENLDLLDQIANGSEEAVNKLANNLLKAQIETKSFTDEIHQNIANMFDTEMSTSEAIAAFENMKTNLLNSVDEMQAALSGLNPGEAFEGENAVAFAENLNAYAAATKMTADEMQEFLSNAGVDAEVVTTPVDTMKWEPETVTEESVELLSTNPTTYRKTSRVVSETLKEIPSQIEVAQINMNTDGGTSGKAPKITKASRGNITPSVTSGGKNSGGGGGGKKKTPQKKAPVEEKKYDDEIERYHEISEAIDDQSRVLERLRAAKEEAYGANYLNYIDKEIAGIKKLNKLTSDHLKEIKKNLAIDKRAISAYGAIFDEDGNIINYDEMYQAQIDKYNSEQHAIRALEDNYDQQKNDNEDYDADGSIKLSIDERKQNNEDGLNNFTKALSQYEETDDLFQETLDELENNRREIGQLTIEKINYEADLKTTYNDFSASLLDFKIEELGDGYEVLGEIAAETAKRFYNIGDAIDITKSKFSSLMNEFANGSITQDQLAKSIEEDLPTLLAQTQDLLSLDKEMMEYYGQAFDKMQEEFSTYLDYIDFGIGKLEHYRTMLSLIGKETDNQMVGTVLRAQYKTLENRATASSNWYEIAKNEYDIIKTRYDQAITEGMGEKELEMLESKLKTAYEKMNEADEQRLADIEAMGQKALEILENNLEDARKKLEENILGSSMDEYMTNLDRLSKKQEEYLTTTNKMYETNKLIRQAQMDMDKTENQRAKQQYNDYVKYIQQLQQSGELSSYELSIAQAKYELLQAQIALEEAQDAKNQVRLTRDAEGNYGYVYTADQDTVSDAEQKVADAENKLYNIGLDGAKDYQSKKAEILQEAIDTFASLEEQYQTGQIASEEEFQQKMNEAKEYYYGLLSQYDQLYYTALGTMQDESYQHTVDYQLGSVDIFSEFESSVNSYLNEVNGHFDEYNNKTAIVREEVGEDLSTLEQNTKNVTTETGNLSDATEDLAKKMSEELQSVREMTSYWGGYRDTVYEAVAANKEMIETLRQIQLESITQVGSDGFINDYSQLIADKIAGGMDPNDPYIQGLISERDRKLTLMSKADDQDYSALMAQAKAEGNDAMYKTWELLRNNKIEKMKEANYEKDMREYIAQGGSTEDDEFKTMMTMRGEKIKYETSQGQPATTLSNDKLLSELKIEEDKIKNPSKYETKTPSPPDDGNKGGNGGGSGGGGSGGGGGTYTITFDTQGGKETIPKQTIAKNGKVKKPDTTPTKDPSDKMEYTFKHWSKSKGGESYGFETSSVTSSFTLYAVWAEQTKKSPEDGGGGKKTVKKVSKVKSRGYEASGIYRGDDPTWASLHGWDWIWDSAILSYGAEYDVLGERVVKEGSTQGTWYAITKNGKDRYGWVPSGLVTPTGYKEVSLDTGGYTGSWGPEGRMAMLHEKELVLNKQDTENFLAGTEILREITHMLDTNTMMASLGAFDLRAITMNSLADQVLQQEVTIHADFPNVSDHNEIEIAIDNLINAASQHAYRI